MRRTSPCGYRSLIKRRISREPTQYITGVQEFWSMDFHVTPQVLIPRPESELLVEQVLSLCGPTPSILDLGTGSGALAVSLAREIE
ncbi:MAG: peptide chain release factor N(5)-glutamine methyltransferase, partial [Deltaproteobacteria bacterium]|nr:peptide chain release factor N(5)-glutamine methyltransferase [Deltaproteobacteria bacterium]